MLSKFKAQLCKNFMAAGKKNKGFLFRLAKTKRACHHETMEAQLDMPIFWGLPWQIQLSWILKQTSKEYDGDDTFRAKYVHSQNVDEPVRMERPESPHTNTTYPRQEFYFHRDHLGIITEITDFEGIIVQRYVYDAFGSVTIYDKDGNEITPSSANYLENPYAFTGRELDPETGLYFYRARYYDPGTGRFLSEDPIGVNGGDANFYRYVGNNSLNFTDPEGENILYLIPVLATIVSIPITNILVSIAGERPPTEGLGTFAFNPILPVSKQPVFGKPLNKPQRPSGRKVETPFGPLFLPKDESVCLVP